MALLSILRLVPAIFFMLSAVAHAAPEQILAYETTEKISAQALQARHAFFNQLATDCFDVTRDGKIHGHLPVADIAFAQSLKMPVFATVSNFAGKDFNADLAHAIITSPAATQTFLDAATKILAAGHYAGLNLDFESITNSDRAAFTAFVATLSTAMRAAGYLTVVSVPAMSGDDPTSSWSGAFDLKALGASADLLQVMTYDENGPWGPPGPVAGLDWVEAAIRYTASVVPGNKISLGLPAFAYDYDLDDRHHDKQINWTDIAPLTAKMHGTTNWDEASSSPNLTYTLNGQHHIVWHEDEKSIGLKTQLVAKYQLAGISIWALGQEDDAFWQATQLPARP